jgi:hypothetical protein
MAINSNFLKFVFASIAWPLAYFALANWIKNFDFKVESLFKRNTNSYQKAGCKPEGKAKDVV